MPGLNSIGMVLKRMDWLAQNQAVIARNVTNMHVPGAKAMKLAAPDFGQTMQAHKVKPTATQPNHTSGSVGKMDTAKRVFSKDYSVSITDNDIHYMDELRKANQTAADHQQMTSLYKSMTQLFSSAMRI